MCPSARRRRNRRRRDSTDQAPRLPAAPARDRLLPAPPIYSDAALRASRPQSKAPPSRSYRLLSLRYLPLREKFFRRSRIRLIADAIARWHLKAASSRMPALRVHALPPGPESQRRLGECRIDRAARASRTADGWAPEVRLVLLLRRWRRRWFATPPARDRYRAPAAPPRLAAALRRRGGISPWPASIRSIPRRSPDRHDARQGGSPPPKSTDRAAPPARSSRSP